MAGTETVKREGPEYLVSEELQRLRYLRPAERFSRARYGVIEVIDATGDTKILWDRHNEAEVAAARTLFADLRRRGHAAFAVNRKTGAQEAQVQEFDPAAESLVMVPQIMGGRHD